MLVDRGQSIQIKIRAEKRHSVYRVHQTSVSWYFTRLARSKFQRDRLITFYVADKKLRPIQAAVSLTMASPMKSKNFWFGNFYFERSLGKLIEYWTVAPSEKVIEKRWKVGGTFPFRGNCESCMRLFFFRFKTAILLLKKRTHFVQNCHTKLYKCFFCK